MCFRTQLPRPPDQERDFSRRQTLGRRQFGKYDKCGSSSGGRMSELQQFDRSQATFTSVTESGRCQKWRRNTAVFRRGTHRVTLILTPTAQNASLTIALCLNVSHLTNPLTLHWEWVGLGGVWGTVRRELRRCAASSEEQHRSLSNVLLLLLLLKQQYSAALAVLLLLLLIKQL